MTVAISSIPPELHDNAVLLAISAEGVATLTLNRPGVRNAYDRTMLEQIASACASLVDRSDLRALIIEAAGSVFCAGADLAWMRRSSTLTDEENLADARCIGHAFSRLHSMPCPTIAFVQGACLGGGLGLAAACDIVVAKSTALFGLTEVRVGLVPFIVAPYIAAAIGDRAARRYILTGATFDAHEAHRLGLVAEIADDQDGLRQVRRRLVGEILKGAPASIRRCKELLRRYHSSCLDDAEQVGLAAERVATERRSDEAMEGLSAFLEKRRPTWFVAADE